MLVAAGALAPAPASPRPHIVLVTADTLRADHLAVYGYSRATSPRLDAFARDARRFRAAITVIPKTGPSLATLFTGRHPDVHGIVANRSVLPADFPLLAERLAAAGYRTAAFVSNPVLSAAKGYARGFAVYRELDGVAAVTAAFRDWAAGSWEQPTFVWLHYIDPHGPYRPPKDLAALFADDTLARAETRRVPLEARLLPGFNVAAVRGALPGYQRIGDEDRVADYVLRYDREIRGVDRAFGEVVDLLAARRLLAESAVVFTADHGESLGEDDYFFEHGWFVGEGSLRVPLVIRAPAAHDGATVTTPVSQLDLAVTMLATAGIEPGDLPGRNLLAQDIRDIEERSILFTNASTYPDRYVGVRRGSWKYVRLVATAASEEKFRAVDGPEQLYDLDRDPREAVNLAGERPEMVATMRAVLARARPVVDRTPAGRTPGVVAPADRERLKALGYVE